MKVLRDESAALYELQLGVDGHATWAAPVALTPENMVSAVDLLWVRLIRARTPTSKDDGAR